MEIKLGVKEVINHFGGITPLHERFEKAGVNLSRKAIEKWKERDSIPTSSWLQIEAIAQEEGSLELLRESAIEVERGSNNNMKSNNINLSKDELSKLYQQMLLIRRFEEKAGQLYGMGLIGGFCHLYIGQEAIAVGMQHNFEEGDSVITTYRDHGLMLTCGSDPKSVLGELMGKEIGCSMGKGGSMHMFDLDKHFYGGHGIVGASVPLGTGIAFANKYKENKKICACYFGDGAANQGQVYEAFNMAQLWSLPVLYIIENNEYAMGTSIARSSATTELYRRGEAFGISGKQVDGMDVFAVIEAAKEAVEFVRSGKGPFILEMKTYRYRGHSMSDPAKYRTKEEVSNMKETRDPIQNLHKYLTENKIISEEDLKKIDKSIKSEIADIVEECKAAPLPDEKHLWTHIYNDV